MRVLHLLDRCWASAEAGAGSGWALPACAEAVARSRHEHEVCLIGGSDLERESAGVLETWTRIAPPGGEQVLAWRGLRSLLRDRGGADAVVAWSAASSRLARLVPGRAAAKLWVASGPPTSGIRADARVHVAVPLETRAAWLSAGAAPDRVHAVDLPAFSAADSHRATARAGLALAEADVAVALIGDPPAAADAGRFLLALGPAVKAGASAVGLIDRRAAGAGAVRRMVRGGAGPLAVRFSDLPPWRFLAAADVAVFEGGRSAALGRGLGSPAWAMAWADALGVPVVRARGWRSTDLPAADEVESRSAAPTELARPLFRLLGDAVAVRRAREAIRAKAREPNPRRFADALDAVIERIAG
jgi:hypothetical protein